MDKSLDQVLCYLRDAEQIPLAVLPHRWMEQICRLWEGEEQAVCVWLILVRSRQMNRKAESF